MTRKPFSGACLFWVGLVQEGKFCRIGETGSTRILIIQEGSEDKYVLGEGMNNKHKHPLWLVSCLEKPGSWLQMELR